jgi:Pyrimidine dimer DNA glycosylase
MRLWSLHPKYLDTKGFVALWRESLLAKSVLEGNVNGYKNHPQLLRFKNSENSLRNINLYLEEVYLESLTRGYHFNKSKFDFYQETVKLTVTTGQIEYESKHLLNKLRNRDTECYSRILKVTNFEPHPLFKIVNGDIEKWEKV